MVSKPIPPQPSETLRDILHHRGFKFSYFSRRLRFPNGTEGDREYIEHPGGAVAVPVTAEGNFLLIRQYRFAIGAYIYEFPAGTLEPNEPPNITVRRELEEETGHTARRWDDLGQFFLAPGYSDETIFAYLARDLEKLFEPPAGDEDEDIEVVELTVAELRQKAIASQDLDAKTIACFHRALELLQGNELRKTNP
ncbi:NUDIX hydrolase [Synechococcus sp. PCC 7336]|uniref:NUDIX hydrolase n=1 Tax=Synechococcus sp. PCC 7336 TaxID=195250 RepID=UPI000344F460|nr:NUDIX hydrolase [Synechococcus sp. PCC 7336]